MDRKSGGSVGRWLLLVIIGTALLTGCRAAVDWLASTRPAVPTSSTDETPKPPSQISIPVMKNDTDTSYEIRPTASVINEFWFDGTYGKVTVMARRGDTGDRTPLLTGTLKLADGKTVECKQDRSTIWNSVDSFEPLNLRCTSELDLSTVVNVDVVSEHGPEK